MAKAEQQLSLFRRGLNWTWLTLLGEGKTSEVQLYDRSLLIAVIGLMGFGFVMVMSASMPESLHLTKGKDPFHFVSRHLFYLVGCVFIAAFVLRFEVKHWEKYSVQLMLVVLLMLIAVLFVGSTVNGARRWLSLGPVRIQVAEIAKFAFIIFISGYLVRRHNELLDNRKGFLKPIGVYGCFAVLILLQPDLGTVVVLFVCTMSLLFLAGAKLSHFFSLIMVGVVIFVLLVLLEPYRLRRVTSFMDPWQDPFGSGYQLTQSLMAYGRGDWFGQGLGNSIQKLAYLPEAHTDFIFAIIGEELGFVGIVLVLSVICFVSLRAIRLGNLCLNSQRPFEGYVAYGVGVWICFQAVVNIGASIGMLPTKGLTLPFVSYGGSSLWVMTTAVMLLIRIDYERRVRLIQAVQGSARS